jgi:hypothetical protein
MPHAPSQRPNDRQRDALYRYQLEGPSVSGRAVVAVLCGMALLALVFTVAANAQQTTTQSTTEQQQVQEEEQQAQAQESQAQEQSTASGSMQADPAEQAATPAPVEGQIVSQPEGTIAASGLMGQPVYSAEGEDIGQISDLLIGEENRLIGVVIGIGGFLGIGEKPIAVEVERLSRASTQDGTEQLVLNYTRAELEQAPEFVTLDELSQQQAQREAQQEALQSQEPQQEGTGATQEPANEGQTQ